MDKKEKQYYQQASIGIFLLVVGGTIFYHYQEGFEWLDSFYFTVITLSTVGYGDFSPETNIGKLFTILYVIIGISIFASFIQMRTTRKEESRREKRLAEKKSENITNS